MIVLLFLFLYLIHKINNMGRGDKKTKKGKIFKGSFGKSRPANAPKVKPAAAPAKKAEEKTA
jgi:30S ribosomal protein S31